MIELRWLKMLHNDNDGTHQTAVNDLSPQHFRVLQYRSEEGPKGEQWWSEWKDIPVIEEVK